MRGEYDIFNQQEFEMIQSLVEAIIESTQQPMVVLDKDLRVVAANKAYYNTFKTEPAETINRFIYELGDREWDVPELHNLLEKVLSEQIVIENYIVSTNFSHIGEKVMSLRANWVQTRDPALKLILLTIQDITDQKRLEQALKTSISEWLKIFDATLDAIFVLSADQRILKVNKSALDLLQIKEEEVTGRHCWEIVHKTDFPVSVCPFLKMRHSFNREHMIMLVRDMTFEVTVDPIFDIDNNLVGAVHIIRDITRLKEAEKQVIESEVKYRLITEHIPDFIVIHSGEKILYANDALLKKLGIQSLEQIKDIPVIDFVHPDYQKAVVERIRKVLTEKKIAEPMEEKFILPDGEIIDVEVRGVPVEYDGEPAIQLIIRDITEHKRIEEAVRQSEVRYRTIFRTARDAIFIMEQDRFIDCNETAMRLFKADREHMIGKTPYEEFSPEFQSDGRMSKEKALEKINLAYSGCPQFFEWRHRTLDGSLFDTEVSLNRFEIGDKLYLLAVVRDITERKMAERALRENEERYRLITENIGDVILVLGTSMNIIYASPSIQKLTGYTNTEGIGECIYKFMPSESANNIQEVIEGEMVLEQQGAPRDRTRQLELQIYHKNGSLIWVGLTCSFLRNEEGRPFSILAVLRDISERKEKEEVMARQLKELESLVKISKFLRMAHSEEEFLPIFIDEVLDLINCEAGAILLYYKEIDALNVVYARGWAEGLLGYSLKSNEGIGGLVFSSGDTYVSRDFKNDPNLSRNKVSIIPEGWGGIAVPIRSSEETLGVFYIFAPSIREFSKEEVKLLNSLSEMLGIALHRSRLYQDAKRRIERLQAIQNVDRAIVESMDTSVLFNVLLREITPQLGMTAMGVLLFDPTELTLYYAADYGFKTDLYKKTRIRLGEGYAGKAGLGLRRIWISDIRVTSEMPPRIMTEEGFVSYVCQPFFAKGQLIGVLELFHKEPLGSDTEWFNYLESIAQQTAIAVDNINLLQNLRKTRTELLLAYESTIEGWSYAMDLRDRETEGHSQRVTEMTLRLARELGIKEDDLIHIKRGALLHDIGKLGVPDAILLKPDKLTEEEWILMRKHPIYAFEMLTRIEYLKPAIDIPYCHHERWDGSGYPRGLKGGEIPLSARIFAVADTFDALSCDRPYRSAWPREKIIEYIKAQSGKQFDPKVVDAFLKIYGSSY